MIKNKKLSKTLIKSLLIILLVIAVIVSILIIDQDSNKLEVASIPNTQTQEPDPSTNPATQEDIARAEENKEKLSEKIEAEKAQAQNPTTGQKEVKPVITYAGQYGNTIEVGGYVDTFEEGGKCTATFTNGSTSFSKEVPSLRGAQSVDCPVISAQTTDFNPKGIWTVTLKYGSVSSSGSSDPKTLEVN